MSSTPSQNSVRRRGKGAPADFHAGRFLCDVLQEAGHDVAWLAARTGSDAVWLEHLLEQPNMDAELFVRIGMPMEPLFMRRVEEVIFGKKPAELAN